MVLTEDLPDSRISNGFPLLLLWFVPYPALSNIEAFLGTGPKFHCRAQREHNSGEKSLN